MHASLSHSRGYGTDQFVKRSLLGGYERAFRIETKFSIWKPISSGKRQPSGGW